jgi:hypothetical protein
VLSAIEAVAETQPAGELTLKGLHRPIPAFNVSGVVDYLTGLDYARARDIEGQFDTVRVTKHVEHMDTPLRC